MIYVRQSLLIPVDENFLLKSLKTDEISNHLDAAHRKRASSVEYLEEIDHDLENALSIFQNASKSTSDLGKHF
jgi:hypothetical protein